MPDVRPYDSKQYQTNLEKAILELSTVLVGKGSLRLAQCSQKEWIALHSAIMKMKSAYETAYKKGKSDTECLILGTVAFVDGYKGDGKIGNGAGESRSNSTNTNKNNNKNAWTAGTAASSLTAAGRGVNDVRVLSRKDPDGGAGRWRPHSEKRRCVFVFAEKATKIQIEKSHQKYGAIDNIAPGAKGIFVTFTTPDAAWRCLADAQRRRHAAYAGKLPKKIEKKMS